jgi:hypothetical protein
MVPPRALPSSLGSDESRRASRRAKLRLRRPNAGGSERPPDFTRKGDKWQRRGPIPGLPPPKFHPQAPPLRRPGPLRVFFFAAWRQRVPTCARPGLRSWLKPPMAKRSAQRSGGAGPAEGVVRAGGSPASSSTSAAGSHGPGWRALAQIAAAGGGLVEAVSEATAGRRLKAGSCSARPPSCSSSTDSRGDGTSASTRGSLAARSTLRSGHGQAWRVRAQSGASSSHPPRVTRGCSPEDSARGEGLSLSRTMHGRSNAPAFGNVTE